MSEGAFLSKKPMHSPEEGHRAKRLLWLVVFGIIVLNIVLFIAASR